MRVKIIEKEDKQELIELGFQFDIVYKGERKDNGYIEVRGFEFEKSELEILD